MRSSDGAEVPADVPDRLPPRADPGGGNPAPDPPYSAEVLGADRYQFTRPVTLADMIEVRRRVIELGGGSVEVYSHTGETVTIDVRWPNGARVHRELKPL